MKKILFVTYGGGHAQALLPIIEQLRASYKISVLALTTAKSIFDGCGYELLTYETMSYLEEADYEKYGINLTGNHDVQSIVSKEESIAYHGINYLNLVREFGAVSASEKYSLLGRQCFLPIDFMSKVLRQVQPDLVVATNSPRTERAVLEAARLVNIKSVCVVDLFALQEKEWLSSPNYATKVCVLNSFVKDMLVKEGRKAEDIVVTGNPAFDKLSNESTRTSALQYQKSSLPKGKKVLFWASQPEPEIHPFTKACGGDPDLPIKIEHKLIDFVENNVEWILVVRHHPSENRAFCYESPRVLFSSKSESMTDLLFSCDCLVTIASTIALEAHLIGKPVVTVDMSIFTVDAPFSDMKISLGVENLLDLESTIKRAINAHDSAPSEYSLLNATDNVIEIINKVIDQ